MTLNYYQNCKIKFEINNQLVYECLVMSFQSFYFEAIKNNER